jgi:hypothetical protein
MQSGWTLGEIFERKRCWSLPICSWIYTYKVRGGGREGHLTRLSLPCCHPAVPNDSQPSKPSGWTRGGAAGSRGVSEECHGRPGGGWNMEGEISIPETRIARKVDPRHFHYKNFCSQVAQGGWVEEEAKTRRGSSPGSIDPHVTGGFRGNGEMSSVWRQYRGLDGG